MSVAQGLTIHVTQWIFYFGTEQGWATYLLKVTYDLLDS